MEVVTPGFIKAWNEAGQVTASENELIVAPLIFSSFT